MNKGEAPSEMRQRNGTEPSPLDPETLAIGALRFFGEDPRRVEAFFTWSGLDGRTLRTAAGKPGFGLAILDFLMQREDLLLGYAEHAGLDPADVAAAHQVWTDRQGAASRGRVGDKVRVSDKRPER